MGLIWKEFELPGKRLPKWKRTFAIDQETGLVFVAAALTGDAEHLVSICALDDRQSTYIRNDHYYVPIGWISEQFGGVRPLCNLIQASVAAAQRLA